MFFRSDESGYSTFNYHFYTTPLGYEFWHTLFTMLPIFALAIAIFLIGYTKVKEKLNPLNQYQQNEVNTNGESES